jgi:2-polyprenyl-3-methyl-5-hydroxy-6-metoxy-1,4-benzoquinol methylase
LIDPRSLPLAVPIRNINFQKEKNMAQQAVKTINETKAQAFADQMLDTLNKAAAALMVSVGHRTELFDTMADLPPATSERIAKAAGLNERYVREWLGAMVEVMAEESNQTVVAGLLDAILPLAPGLIERLREGIEVMDIGCGRGRALILMARTFPQSSFTGYDFSEEAITAARAEAARQGLANINYYIAQKGKQSYESS